MQEHYNRKLVKYGHLILYVPNPMASDRVNKVLRCSDISSLCLPIFVGMVWFGYATFLALFLAHKLCVCVYMYMYIYNTSHCSIFRTEWEDPIREYGFSVG